LSAIYVPKIDKCAKIIKNNVLYKYKYRKLIIKLDENIVKYSGETRWL